MNYPASPAPTGGRDDGDLPATGRTAQSEQAPEGGQSDREQPAEAEADPIPDGYEPL
jgi:hypothetical protein